MPICTSSCNSFFETEIWLDIVAKGQWKRLEVRKNNGTLEASFPIVKTRKYGCKVLTTPFFTQTIGIYFEDTGAKLAKRLEKEKKHIYKIIEMLPKGYSCDFYLDANNKYVLPFKWKGFDVVPCFTYRIEELDDLDKVWKGLKENIRTDIRKADKIVTISNCDADTIYDLQEKVFLRQGRHFPYKRDIIKSICEELKKYDAIDLIKATDNYGNIHAAALFVYDDKRCYYLMGGADSEFRKSGATSLLVWEGIKRASERGVNIFDFEGSMIEDIERFVRAFGAEPCVYYHVMKYRLCYKIMNSIKVLTKQVLGYK